MKKYDYYVLQMMGCVEPILRGPYKSVIEQEKAYIKMIEEYGDREHSFAVFQVTKGSEVIF